MTQFVYYISYIASGRELTPQFGNCEIILHERITNIDQIKSIEKQIKEEYKSLSGYNITVLTYAFLRTE